MQKKDNYSLLNYNSFGLDITCSTFYEFDSIRELQEIIKTASIAEVHNLCIGQGSNLLFLNNFNGIILHSNIQGINVEKTEGNYIWLNIGSGVIWDDVCKYAAENNYWGIENLSGIPGETGAAAVQNIGAYGAEIKDVIYNVHAVAKSTGNQRIFNKAECNYAYRDSIFKAKELGKYIITSITIKLSTKPQYNFSYASLRHTFSENKNYKATEIREEIIKTRNAKLPDPKTLGNAGSFFKNPVITKVEFKKLEAKYPNIPFYELNNKEYKIPAAWLIEQCGWKNKE
jgi:UDP-N-acetylenolpyruvoylglucosamine reductase